MEARRERGRCARSLACSARAARGIRALGPARQHGDRPAAGFQRALVRRGVDPERHAADDRQARGRAAASEIARDHQALVRRAPRADDRDRAARRARSSTASRRRADRVQDRGRIGKVEQRRRIGRVAAADRSRAGAQPARRARRPRRAASHSAATAPRAFAAERIDQLLVRTARARRGSPRARPATLEMPGQPGRRATSAACSRRRRCSCGLLDRRLVLAERGRPQYVAARDAIAAVEVGDRPRDAQQAVAAAGADRAALVEHPQRTQRAVAGAARRRAAPPGDSSALRQPARASWRSRAARPAPARRCDFVTGSAASSSAVGRSTATSRSIRSSSAPESLRR